MNLSYDDFLSFTKIDKCVYCGKTVNWKIYSTHNRIQVSYNLDRVDNTKGYTPDNCVVCCPVCNFMKGSKSKEEFLTQIATIHLHQSTSLPKISS